MHYFEQFGEMLREQLEFRQLLYQITARDLLLRYKQTAMAFAWAILMPLLNTIIHRFEFQFPERI